MILPMNHINFSFDYSNDRSTSRGVRTNVYPQKIRQLQKNCDEAANRMREIVPLWGQSLGFS